MEKFIIKSNERHDSLVGFEGRVKKEICSSVKRVFIRRTGVRPAPDANTEPAWGNL